MTPDGYNQGKQKGIRIPLNVGYIRIWWFGYELNSVNGCYIRAFRHPFYRLLNSFLVSSFRSLSIKDQLFWLVCISWGSLICGVLLWIAISIALKTL